MYVYYDCNRFVGLQSFLTLAFIDAEYPKEFQLTLNGPCVLKLLCFNIFGGYPSIKLLIYNFKCFQNQRKLLLVYLICEILCIFANTTLALSIIGTTISAAIYSINYNNIFYALWFDIGLVTSFFVIFIGKYLRISVTS